MGRKLTATRFFLCVIHGHPLLYSVSRHKLWLIVSAMRAGPTKLTKFPVAQLLRKHIPTVYNIIVLLREAAILRAIGRKLRSFGHNTFEH
jgi:hypothetical protein